MSNLSASGSGGAYGGGLCAVVGELNRYRGASEGGGPPPRPPAAPRVPSAHQIGLHIGGMAAPPPPPPGAPPPPVSPGSRDINVASGLHIARLSVVAPDGVPEWEGSSRRTEHSGQATPQGLQPHDGGFGSYPTVEEPEWAGPAAAPPGTEEIVRVWRNDAGLGIVVNERNEVRRAARRLEHTEGARQSGARHNQRGVAPSSRPLILPPPPLPPSTQVVQLDASGGAAEANHDPSQGAAVAVGDAILAIDGSPLGDTPLR